MYYFWTLEWISELLFQTREDLCLPAEKGAEQELSIEEGRGKCFPSQKKHFWAIDDPSSGSCIYGYSVVLTGNVHWVTRKQQTK